MLARQIVHEQRKDDLKSSGVNITLFLKDTVDLVQGKGASMWLTSLPQENLISHFIRGPSEMCWLQDMDECH